MNHNAYKNGKKEEQVIAFDENNLFLDIIPRSKANKDLKMPNPNGPGDIMVPVWHRTGCVFV